MKTKQDIVKNWLARYTGTPNEDFGKYILLTNFSNYVELFAKIEDVEVRGKDKNLQQNKKQRRTRKISMPLQKVRLCYSHFFLKRKRWPVKPAP